MAEFIIYPHSHMRTPQPVSVTQDRLKILRSYASSRTVEKRLHERSRIILLLYSGISVIGVAEELALSAKTVHKWKSRWNKKGIEGLTDLPRPGNRKNHSPEKKAEIVSLACSDPGDGRKRRTHRQIAALAKVSTHSVWKTLKENDLKPHQTDYWCGKSPDPEFKEKTANIIGLYMNPPENALVLCVDEKTQIQALQRSQPVLPGLSGKPEKQTVTYLRHGTANLITALETATGEITASNIDRNTSENFLKFLKKLYRKYPGKQLHVIADNLSVHKQKDVKAWVESRRRLHMHFTPTYASWLNQVETFFSILSRQVLKDAVWTSKKHLVNSLMKYIKPITKNSKSRSIGLTEFITLIHNLCTSRNNEKSIFFRSKISEIKFKQLFTFFVLI